MTGITLITLHGCCSPVPMDHFSAAAITINVKFSLEEAHSPLPAPLIYQGIFDPPYNPPERQKINSPPAGFAVAPSSRTAARR